MENKYVPYHIGRGDYNVYNQETKNMAFNLGPGRMPVMTKEQAEAKCRDMNQPKGACLPDDRDGRREVQLSQKELAIILDALNSYAEPMRSERDVRVLRLKLNVQVDAATMNNPNATFTLGSV